MKVENHMTLYKARHFWLHNPTKSHFVFEFVAQFTFYFRPQAKELCLRVFARYPEFSGGAEMSSFELLSDPKYCGKMKVMEKLLRVFKEEHSKLLVFSRSTQVRSMQFTSYNHFVGFL